jgi:serine/threonine protein phosphatase 1
MRDLNWKLNERAGGEPARGRVGQVGGQAGVIEEIRARFEDAFRRTADSLRTARAGVENALARAAEMLRPRTPAPQPVRTPGFFARVPEGRRVYAVGDIHGRADLLIRLLRELQEDVDAGGFAGRPIIVFLGDYIDRGFQSREVIDVLRGDMLSSFETYFLKGNHEAAMLDFLSDAAIGPQWAEYGGAETLVSYGVRPPRPRAGREAWEQASAELRARLPEEHRHFLTNLDLSVRIGDYVFVHAGVRPDVDLDEQKEQDLLWIRDEFLYDRRPLGVVVVHGHTPATAPYADSRRIGVDTGAYLSGRLTAVRLQDDRVDFISTGPTLQPGPSERVLEG